MRQVVRCAALLLAAVLAGCASSSGYMGIGVAPDDIAGMVRADSACDFDRGTDDMASPCYVTRRPYDYVAGRYE